MFNGIFADEREVIAACLDYLGVGERQIVDAMTSHGDHGIGDDEEDLYHARENTLPDFSRETLIDFLAKNRRSYPVDPDLNPEGRLICLSEEETRHILRDEDGWDRLRSAYPGSEGTIELSRVGFNREVTQAVIYAGQTVHWLAGSGNCWIFSRSDGAWIRKGSTGGAWIA